jgi:membrane-anchored protein YejM (alkaline phosphatase superfamily)
LKAGDTPLDNILPREDPALQKKKLQLMQKLDNSLLGRIGEVDQIESTIANYELAYRMQASVPELTDFSDETKATKKLYGLDSDDKHCRSYGAQCLMARRLVERGVRFIELTCPDTGHDRWDQHSNLIKGHSDNAHAVDQPIAGLIKDLKGRGLLEQTLIVFSGEFGRTPFAEMRAPVGRDHNPQGFSSWMAGAGIKGGTVYGKTDDYGYRAVENKTSIHDMHATMLHLLGIDHELQTFRFSGRDIRLTDVHGHVIHDILS